MTSQPRPARCIWLTEDEVENLSVPGFPEGARFLRAAWDAAPADAAEAVKRIMWGYRTHVSDSEVEAVLLVLVYPHTEQA